MVCNSPILKSEVPGNGATNSLDDEMTYILLAPVGYPKCKGKVCCRKISNRLAIARECQSVMDSWSKEDYSRHIWEASMAVEKLPEVNPPSGRVTGRGLLTLPALEKQNDGEIRDSRKSSRVS
ncbi:hypothetical protein D1007_01093 [Hordeum vulgare]|nr:hypothetical protein D1007_01093 [Hordeum vulgare]